MENSDSRASKVTRKQFLKVAGAGAACAALLGVAGCSFTGSGVSLARTPEASRSRPPSYGWYGRVYRSRPDLLPPSVVVTSPADGVAPGYVFSTPAKGPGQHGPIILDNQGETVWYFNSGEKQIRDFRAQSYRGKPVLTWWEGNVSSIRGLGEYVVLDDSYQEIARLAAGNGYAGDLHEFLISERDTALVTIYHRVNRDLTSSGGPVGTSVLDGIFQELDIETGEVLFEWRSLDHVSVEETYRRIPEDPGEDLDYFHINSIEVDHDDNFLVSARNTWASYKISRRTGEIIWRLGGKKSDFEEVPGPAGGVNPEGPGTETAYQHDTRRQPDGTLTIFDNGAAPEAHEESRAIVLELDEDRMEVSLVREYTHPEESLLAGYLGNMQPLPNDNVFVGWGSEPYFSEFTRDGRLVFDARIPPGYTAYRSYRLPWSGYPEDKPAVAAEGDPGGGATLHVSWNGATEVASWEALAGPAPDRLRPAASAPREGFETTIAVQSTQPFVAVRAKDRSGRPIGVSETLRL